MGFDKKIKKEDVHNAADEAGIEWDDDNIFKIISEELTGERELDRMSEESLQTILNEIQTNPAPFTKKAHFAPGKFRLKSKDEKGEPEFEQFRGNHDYTGGNYLDKVERRLKRLSETLKTRKHNQEAKELDRMIKNVRPKK